MLTQEARWLLEAPITSCWGDWIPLPLLDDGETPGSVCALNLSDHFMDGETIARVLLDLWSKSLIVIQQPLGSVDQVVAQIALPFALLHTSNRYTLSQSGFDLWEREAEPDWHCFTDQRSVRIENRVVELNAGSVDAAISYASDLCQLNGQVLESPTVIMDPIYSWRPRPWKTLPLAYRLTAQTIGIHDGFTEIATIGKKWLSNSVTIP